MANTIRQHFIDEFDRIKSVAVLINRNVKVRVSLSQFCSAVFRCFSSVNNR